MPAIYNPPLRDMRFVMHELLDVTTSLNEVPAYADIDADTIDQVLAEAGKFCAEVLLPLNLSGDQEGCHFDAATHAVTVPKGFREAYRQYRDGGWPSLSADPEFGGQGLPHLIEIAFSEMKYATNQAWTMYPSLAHGAYTALLAHGTDAQKKLYLPKITSGEWLGTMCLTESHCGTDLGMLRSKAEPQPDGSFRITGNKIFISAGEHDMADNIVHLVLARLPDAPAGSKGISLFIVPKFLPKIENAGTDETVSCGERNPIFCGAIEHKMGIHGNATCQLNLDGAAGWMVGQPNKGLAAMFVMMNGARLGVGVQGLGLTEIAYQNAAAYAKDRIQGRSLTGVKSPDQPADPIIVHPDVRKMLLTARAYAEGGRAFATWVALQSDLLHHPDEAVRKDADDMMALMTPVVKAFMTDNGFFAASGCLQVFGGHGYIAELGIEQMVRDARINMIYEGTNTIQALDLLGRKILSDNGARMKKFGRMVTDFIEAEGTNEAMAEFINPLADIGDKVTKLTMELGMKAFQDPDEVGGAAVDYLRVVGHLIYAYFWARMAKIALEKEGEGDPFYRAKLATARFYFAKLLPETATAIRAARAGSKVLMEMEADLF
ncbi:MAG: acyl-CoA dehydrogenase C-terminal domain-containing protein [Burkholderiaceae bacterium]